MHKPDSLAALPPPPCPPPLSPPRAPPMLITPPATGATHNSFSSLPKPSLHYLPPHHRPPDLSFTTTHQFHPPPHLLPHLNSQLPVLRPLQSSAALLKSGDIGKSTQWIQRFTGGSAKAITVQTKAIPEPMKLGLAAGSGQALLKSDGATGAQIQQGCRCRLVLEFAGQPDVDARAVARCGVAK